MRRPFGSDTHATGSETARRLRHALADRAEGACRGDLSAALDYAAAVTHGTQTWSEVDVAAAFGVRPTMVRRKERPAGWGRIFAGDIPTGEGSEVARRAWYAAVVAGALAAGWDPSHAGPLRLYQRIATAPETSV